MWELPGRTEKDYLRKTIPFVCLFSETMSSHTTENCVSREWH